VFPLQGCSLEKDETSLDFTMLLRLESPFPFALSPPLAGGNRAILLGVILLDLGSCSLPVFQTLEFWIVETWQSSLTLVDFPDSYRLPGFLGYLDSSWSCGSLCFL
jgi:hypothetical protein